MIGNDKLEQHFATPLPDLKTARKRIKQVLYWFQLR
jgi:hypothetical protein